MKPGGGSSCRSFQVTGTRGSGGSEDGGASFASGPKEKPSGTLPNGNTEPSKPAPDSICALVTRDMGGSEDGDAMFASGPKDKEFNPSGTSPNGGTGHAKPELSLSICAMAMANEGIDTIIGAQGGMGGTQGGQ